ncbi:hypothetical protein B0H16DRAFT_1726958 [Mycena metata]|uniref:Uncharacterized protein n=1 Tax=Mycena metata TaxID=1033252 RepID=A0AAD7N5B1_9AGAR|nr:hypothetical protein B0H16DRAFT_1726958 [Mycena metata]
MQKRCSRRQPLLTSRASAPVVAARRQLVLAPVTRDITALVPPSILTQLLRSRTLKDHASIDDNGRLGHKGVSMRGEDEEKVKPRSCLDEGSPRAEAACAKRLQGCVSSAFTPPLRATPALAHAARSRAPRAPSAPPNAASILALRTIRRCARLTTTSSLPVLHTPPLYRRSSRERTITTQRSPLSALRRARPDPTQYALSSDWARHPRFLASFSTLQMDGENEEEERALQRLRMYPPCSPPLHLSSPPHRRIPRAPILNPEEQAGERIVHIPPHDAPDVSSALSPLSRHAIPMPPFPRRCSLSHYAHRPRRTQVPRPTPRAHHRARK